MPLPWAGAGITRVYNTGMLTFSAPPECKGIWILNHEQEERKEKGQALVEKRGGKLD